MVILAVSAVRYGNLSNLTKFYFEIGFEFFVGRKSSPTVTGGHFVVGLKIVIKQKELIE